MPAPLNGRELSRQIVVGSRLVGITANVIGALVLVRVIVIDSREIMRVGLRAVLAREPDLHVIGMAAGGEEGLALVGDLEPDVALVDYDLGSPSGVEVCAKIHEHHPAVQVIVLAAFVDDDVVRRSVHAGAKAYLTKDVDGDELKGVIRNVAQGRSMVDPRVVGRVMRWAKLRGAMSGEVVLSPREIEALRMVAAGATSGQIARSMGVGVNTAKTYVRRALDKLDCNTRAEAAAAASRRGLL